MYSFTPLLFFIFYVLLKFFISRTFSKSINFPKIGWKKNLYNYSQQTFSEFSLPLPWNWQSQSTVKIVISAHTECMIFPACTFQYQQYFQRWYKILPTWWTQTHILQFFMFLTCCNTLTTTSYEKIFNLLISVQFNECVILPDSLFYQGISSTLSDLFSSQSESKFSFHSFYSNVTYVCSIR